MKVAVIFENFGPYHLARLRAAGQVCTLLAFQINHRSRDYNWEPNNGGLEFASLTLNAAADASQPLSTLERVGRLKAALAEFRPDCVFVPGWSNGYSLACLGSCRARGIPIVMMSETTEYDSVRRGWKERFKRRIVRMCSAALVGGAPHAEYIAKLGMPKHRIFTGYDVVDNAHFARTAHAARQRREELRSKLQLPATYLLASARFIEPKNLPGLLVAFAAYRFAAGSDRRGCCSPLEPWALVILGDGPLRPLLVQRVSELGLNGCVILPGFKQYAELPMYYGLADAFVHASTSEPWGLVVNEAMAAGLPVLVSNRCGCASELVREGLNGFTFDPQNTRELAEIMLKTWRLGPQLSSMGIAGAELISKWDLNRFAKGFYAAAGKAVGTPLSQTTTGPNLLRLFSAR